MDATGVKVWCAVIDEGPGTAAMLSQSFEEEGIIPETGPEPESAISHAFVSEAMLITLGIAAAKGGAGAAGGFAAKGAVDAVKRAIKKARKKRPFTELEVSVFISDEGPITYKVPISEADDRAIDSIDLDVHWTPDWEVYRWNGREWRGAFGTRADRG